MDPLVVAILLAVAVFVAATWYGSRRMRWSVPIHEFNVIGACIEGHHGAQYATKAWLGTHTAFDIVNPSRPIRSVVDGRQLHNLNEISDHYANNSHVGPLKECIIDGFPMEYLDDQCTIIRHYMENVLSDGESFHVHVHRGTRMGQKHIEELQRRLVKSFDREDFVNAGTLFPRKSLTFGYGYELNQLDPGYKPEYYYSVSLFIGFAPWLDPGDTIMAETFADFGEMPLFRGEKAKFKVTNDLALREDELADRLKVVAGRTPKLTIAIVRGIVIPDNPRKDFGCTVVP